MLSSTKTNIVVFGLITSLFLIYSVTPAFATVSFQYDSSDKIYYNEHGAKIQIIDSQAITSSIDTIQVKLSAPNGERVQLTFTETGPTTNQYYFPFFIKFTETGSTNQNVPQLKVGASYPITVTVTNMDRDVSDTITVENPVTVNSIPSPFPNQPVWVFEHTCTAYGNDSDNDGICDYWEDGSTWSSNGECAQFSTIGGLCIPYNSSFFYFGCSTTYPGNSCPNKDVKDIYVEVDWMKGHKPISQSMTDVVNAFNAKGIKLHIQESDMILGTDGNPYHTNAPLTPMDPTYGGLDTSFERIKRSHYGLLSERTSSDRLTAKHQVFHYVIFGHAQTGTPSPSGSAEMEGNDIFITLGNFAGGQGSKDDQAGTFMHELGHNLKLKHGGDVDDNCKPNYPSVMSYSRQFTTPIGNRPLDYSSGAYTQIIESSLNELSGVGLAAAGKSIAFSTPTGIKVDTAGVPPSSSNSYSIDWDNSNAISTANIPAQNIDNFSSWQSCTNTSTDSTLNDYDDWNNLLLNFRLSSTSANSDGGTKTNTDGDDFSTWLDQCPDLKEDGKGDPYDGCPEPEPEPIDTTYEKPSSSNIFFVSTVDLKSSVSSLSETVTNDKLSDSLDQNCNECKGYEEPVNQGRVDEDMINGTKISQEVSVEDVRNSRIAVIESVINQIKALPPCVFSNEPKCEIESENAKQELENDMIQISKMVKYDEFYGIELKTKDTMEKISGTGNYSEKGPLIKNSIAQKEILLSLDNIFQSNVNGATSKLEIDLADIDYDGIVDLVDNCPSNSNPGQEDTDLDGIGNVCDKDETIIYLIIVILIGGIILLIVIVLMFYRKLGKAKGWIRTSGRHLKEHQVRDINERAHYDAEVEQYEYT